VVATAKPKKSTSKKRPLEGASDEDEEKPPPKKAKKAASPPKKLKKQQKDESDSEAASELAPKRNKVSKAIVSKSAIDSDDEKSESESVMQPPESPEVSPKIGIYDCLFVSRPSS
jgi:hypothetical protein